ncbi:MlaA family lipoprotein [Helicobacter mesocricetorum]|uniref:MlaA family lipoprotein n=1 Tax=Helicobacter mesocricetorum TaxID=87012 RepID=UPI000CF180E0|nr:VacJ family lipoprotein [Helicobacter mesocricetorum]
MKKLFLILIFICNCYALDLESFEEEYQQQPINDPLEKYNRFINQMNWGFYDYIFSPILEGYNCIMPLGFRIGIENFFENLRSPLRFLGHILVLQTQDAVNEFGRFSLNSTMGILGIFDIASTNKLYSKDIDFGIVFGKWGMNEGFSLVLPLLGQSNLRDTLGLPLNSLISPTTYIDPSSYAVGVYIGQNISYAAKHKDALDSIRKDSLDNYILMRQSYQAYRDKLIKE